MFELFQIADKTRFVFPYVKQKYEFASAEPEAPESHYKVDEGNLPHDVSTNGAAQRIQNTYLQWQSDHFIRWSLREYQAPLFVCR